MEKSGTIINDRYKLKLFEDGSLYRDDGTAEVYLADDLTTSESVVLKLSRGETNERTLRNEIEHVKHLKHVRVSSYVDDFQWDGALCLVMKFIPGRSLDLVLQEEIRAQKHFDEKVVAKWGCPLLEILDSLHRQAPALLHRDVKPGNIILGEDDEIHLIDFGLSKNDEQSTTIHGYSACSPPEQISQTNETTTSDIYAVGATLYWLITGKEPALSSLRVRPNPEVTFLDPLLPIKEIRPDVHARFIQIVEKAMKVNSHERYRTALEFKEDLDAFLDGRPAPTPQPLLNEGSDLVVLLGREGSGKSTLLASLLTILNENDWGTAEPYYDIDGFSYAEYLQSHIQQSRFPPQTPREKIWLSRLKFVLDDTAECFDLVFVDGAGEEVVKRKRDGSAEIAKGLGALLNSICRLLVIVLVPIDELRESDRLIEGLINGVKALRGRPNPSVILLVTKSDTIKTEHSIKSLLDFNMPRTMGSFGHLRHFFGSFTVGKVDLFSMTGDIEHVDLQSAEKVIRAIFFSLHGRNLP